MSVVPLSLDALEATLRVAAAQLAVLRAELEGAALPRATQDALPERCGAVPEDRCGLRNPDARVDVGGMGGAPAQWVCRGCGARLE